MIRNVMALARHFADASALRAALLCDAARWPDASGDPLRDALRAEAVRAAYTLHRLGYVVHVRRALPRTWSAP